MLGQAERHFILTEKNPAALAEGLLRVAEHPAELRREIGGEARRLMVDTMSMDHSVQVHCDLYRKHVARRFGGREALSPHG